MGPSPAKRSRRDAPQAPADLPLFVDHGFPQDDALQIPSVVWRRPKEICTRPRFIVDGATRRDVCQGNLSNCWFLSAVSCLSLYPQLLERVVPAGQDFEDGYVGSFRFQFWQYGKWVQVVVDDLLPVSHTPSDGDPTRCNLLFMRSDDSSEFWSALLEKAYAKLKGGYSALRMGFAGEALVDMTGGIVQSGDTGGPAGEVWSHLNHTLQRGALICCGNTQGEQETSNSMGILCYHMYAVTGAREVQTPQGTACLLRIRNPWGHTEWLGPWRDGGPEWQYVVNLQEIEVVNLEDGEFWMMIEDFQINFQVLEICHLGPESLARVGGAARPWECAVYEGRWVRGLSAGGSIDCRDSFWMNPQFSLELQVDDDQGDPQPACSFIVSVMQKHCRLRRARSTRVACYIFQGDETHAYLFEEKLGSSQPLFCAGPGDNAREVVVCSRLPPGRYVIIPSLEKPSDEGDFLIRVLKEKNQSRSPGGPGVSPDMPLLSPGLSENLLHHHFLQYASGDGRITGPQLHLLLSCLLGEFAPALPGFSPDACRSILASVDIATLGSLEWEQFAGLWETISAGTRIFCDQPRQEVSTLGRDQMVPALQAAGLPVDDFLVHLSCLRYAEQDGSFSYPNFICCLLKLQRVTGMFQAADPSGSGAVTLNYRQCMRLAVYS